MYAQSEFDEDECNTAPPELPKRDDKESQLDLPEDLKLDDDETGAENAEDTAADDVEGDFYACLKLVDW